MYGLKTVKSREKFIFKDTNKLIVCEIRTYFGAANTYAHVLLAGDQHPAPLLLLLNRDVILFLYELLDERFPFSE